jgi:uncharacterized protein
MIACMDIILDILRSAGYVFYEAALYVLFGFAVAGLLRMYIQPDSVVHYFRHGRFRSVLYAALLGIPVPLCSCGVVPAVAGLKKQGANNGACLAFLISAPETGADSIALTYSLMDPIMTVMRPVAALLTASVAGLLENFTGRSYGEGSKVEPDRTCLVDGCCDGIDCDPATHRGHHTVFEKLRAGMRFAFGELMDDLAVYFMLGILLAGVITAIVPESALSGDFGSGLWAYLGMLAVSLPLYVCATLSTPVAAALVLKGLSPGAALVLLLAGPATNVATITMVGGILGKRSLGLYLGSIIVCTLGLAFVTDAIYHSLGVSASAVAGANAAETIPGLIQWVATGILAALIARSLWHGRIAPLLGRFRKDPQPHKCAANEHACCCDRHSHSPD